MNLLVLKKCVRSYLTIAIAVAVLSTAGCNSSGLSLSDVRGTVTLDGQVVSVEFVPASGGRTSNGATDDQGKYRLIYSPQYAGASVGSHTVEIQVEGEVAEALVGSTGRAKLEKNLEVESGSNVIDLELRDFAPSDSN